MSKIGINTSDSEVRMRHRRQAYYHGKYHREVMMVGVVAIVLFAIIG